MIGPCSPRRSLLMAGWLVLTSFVLTGCGWQKKQATVEGKATIDGSPANSGNVIFTSDDGARAFSVRILPDGTYRAIDVPLGSMKVAVKPASRQQRALLKKKGKTAQEAARVPTGPAVPIPKKYHDADTSGLTTTIQSGSNTYNIEISSK